MCTETGNHSVFTITIPPEQKTPVANELTISHWVDTFSPQFRKTVSPPLLGTYCPSNSPIVLAVVAKQKPAVRNYEKHTLGYYNLYVADIFIFIVLRMRFCSICSSMVY